MSTNQHSDQSLETKVVKEFYAAINRYDVPAVIELCDPEIVRIEPWGFPLAGTYQGHEEMAAHISKGRETWAEGACEPEKLIVSGNRVIAFLHVRVRLKSNQQWIEGRLADVLTFKDGKVIEMRTFEDSQEALKYAGVDAAPKG